MLKQGDIYITKLERGFYGAIRIVKIGKLKNWDVSDYVLLYVTPYCKKEKPKITDKTLLTPLNNVRFKCNGREEVGIYATKNIEENNEYLGNISISLREKKLKIEI